jgi:LuxR family maltose regulon positive regulatory protein
MDVNDTNPWQDSVDLLRLVKDDYEGVRKNLKIAYETVAEREGIANQRLTQALLLRGGYRTLSLVSVSSGDTVSQIGKVILGETIPYKIPKTLSLDVHCFERLEVYSGNNKLEHWQNASAKAIFKLFILKLGEPIPKEVLIEYVWPEYSIDTANNNLKVAIHNLRKLLNRFLYQEDNFPSVVFRYGCYELNQEIELHTDVEQFERHWAIARRFEKEGNLSDAIREFKLAEALYTGDFLEDEPYDDQTLIRRETLKDIYLIVMSKLAEYSFDSMDYEESIFYCQKILAKDNCREDAYRRLMRCYNRLGNRSRAMRWYKICYRTVQKELDTTPEHTTIELYKLLLKDAYI